MAHQGAASLKPAGMCLRSSGLLVLYSGKSSIRPFLSTPRTRTTVFSTLGQETGLEGAQEDSVEGAAEACPGSWSTLRNLQISVSVTRLWILQAHKDASATKPVTAQTAAAHSAADEDTTF